MSVTLASMVTEILQRLGDSSAQIWTIAETESNITEGYNRLTKRTGCLFGTALAPDYAFAFNFTSEFEREYVMAVSGWYADGPAQFTSQFERDYVDNAKGPANHTEHWEYNGGYVATTEVSALVDLPDDLHEIERATWNTRRMEALRSRDVEESDSRYELNKGIVEATIQDKDGIGTLRKWRVPATAYAPYALDTSTDGFTYTSSFEAAYIPTGWEATGPLQFTCGDDATYATTGSLGQGTHNFAFEVGLGLAPSNAINDDGYGILRDITGIVTLAVVGIDGDLVQVDGQNVFEDFGILGPVYKETNNLRIEYRRRGADLSPTQDFEIQDRYTVYVRHYAQARALEREGPGQDLQLSAHYQMRYEAGIQRMLKRKQAMQYQRAMVIGGRTNIIGKKQPRVAMPYQYGKVVR